MMYLVTKKRDVFMTRQEPMALISTNSAKVSSNKAGWVAFKVSEVGATSTTSSVNSSVAEDGEEAVSSSTLVVVVDLDNSNSKDNRKK